ncbi:PAS domain S-box-containing protein [Halovenus aranensis]|jgi:PAS domain S-box-containing protein|uniref:histidine kinase n=1 Tax=Halovenus aranensis TaxID=890420 RepID=A0A1G8Z181_9EURY|nr:PAS domain-containing sensor histidine kinase [Halovenus aranensis]SDK08879.1 PAS domain S-box-containing protein [Halovenus aranensis]
MSDDIDSAESRYAYLVEQAEDGLYMMDKSGEFTVVNEAFVELTGYDREEIVGSGPALLLEDDDLEELNTHIRGALRTDGDAGAVLTTIVAKSGKRKPVEIRFNLLPADERYNGLTGVVRDVRARRHREQKLDVLSRVLRHNVRNKLNLIFGHAQVIQGAENGQYAEAASQIEEAANDLMELSEKARTAQTEVGFNPSVEGQTDLVELVEHLAVQFRREHPAAEITTALPEQLVANVPKSYRIAVSELVENAIEHNPAEEPSVRLTLDRTDHSVVTAVEDGCPSIPETDLRAINEGEETPLVHSMGIGLWLANWVADTVGGELRFERLPDDSGNRAKIVLRGL